MKLNIGLVDLGINNLFSIDNVIKYLGQITISSENKILEKLIVLFFRCRILWLCITNFKNKKLDEMIKEYANQEEH